MFHHPIMLQLLKTILKLAGKSSPSHPILLLFLTQA
jgi:hypothetical protein